MSAFQLFVGDEYKLKVTIPIEITVQDLFEALISYPTNQTRVGIIKNAKSFYDPHEGKSYYNPYRVSKSQYITYMSIIRHRFPEIPVSYLHEAIEKMEK